jgi:luciferase-like monooxygenase
MAIFGASERIQSEVGAWDGIANGPHRFGGVEFMLGKREIGHVHGDSLVDVPLPTRVRDELVASGQAEPHHVLPQSGWVSVHLNQPGDVDRAIWILRRSYHIAREQMARKLAFEHLGHSVKS